MRTVRLTFLLLFALPVMAQISEITAAECTAAATSCTLGTHKYGDLEITVATRASNTAASLPSGYTNIASGGANTFSTRFAYRFLNGSETSTGTFTNAARVAAYVFRGADIRASGPIGGFATYAASSTTMRYCGTTGGTGCSGSLAFTDSSGSSWLVGIGACASCTAGNTAPTGMTLQSGISTTTLAASDTAGGVSSFTSQTVTVTTTGAVRSAVIEILAAPARSTSSNNLVQEYNSGHTGVVSTTPFTYKIPVDSTLSNNLLSLVFTACGQTTTACDTSPSITSVTDNQSNTWVADATETNATDHYTTYGYHVCGATAGVTLITVTFSAAVADFHYIYKQRNGIATSSCVDGTPVGALVSGPGGSAATDMTPGSITTTADGSIFDVSCIYVSNDLGSNFASAISIPGGSTMDAADLSLGFVSYSFKQTTHGALSPYAEVVNTNAQNFNCVASAWKTASAGTAPSGMYVKHIQYTHNTIADPTSIIFPSDGNLVVGLTSMNNQVVTSVSDSSTNSYTIIAPGANHGSIFYAPAATTSNTLIVKPTIGGALTSLWYMLYDVVGAATSPADGNTNGTGTQSGSSNISWTPGTAPSTQPGIAFLINGFGTGPASAVTPGIFDCVYYPNENDTDKTCNGDVFTHYAYSSTSAPAYTFTMANGAGGSAWDTVIAYFKAAPTSAVPDSSNGGVDY